MRQRHVLGGKEAILYEKLILPYIVCRSVTWREIGTEGSWIHSLLKPVRSSR